MIGTKPLKPSLREKKRYLRFQVKAARKFSFEAVSTSVEAELQSLIGKLGAAKAGLTPVANKWNHSSQEGIFRVNRGYLDHLRATFSLMNSINNTQIIIRSVKASGMINKA